MNRLGGGRAFVKKTKKGTVVKVVSEVYLRDDVWCGRRGCAACAASSPEARAEEEAEEVADGAAGGGEAEGGAGAALGPRLGLLGAPAPVLVVDTNVVLHQFDALAALSNVVVPQTVAAELQARSVPLWTRLRALFREPERHFYLFANEHARQTHVVREPGESANDRNDRAVRRVAQWLGEHCAPQGQRVELVTADRASLVQARAARIPARSFTDYVRREHPALLDRVRFEDDPTALPALFARTAGAYAEHLSEDEAAAGLKKGALVQGVLRIAAHNVFCGTAALSPAPDAPPNLPRAEMLVLGRDALNRAIDGDLVALEPLPPARWRPAPAVIQLDDSQDETEPVAGPGTGTGTGTPCGRVVAILRRSLKQYCGTLMDLAAEADAGAKGSPAEAEGGEQREYLFRCTDPRIPKVRVRIGQAAALRNKLLVVRVDGWGRTSLYPHGHYARALGDVGDQQAETDALLVQYDVPTHEFSPAVLACLPPPSARALGPADLATRLDLRAVPIFSIDPPGCTDIDDALHVRALGGGTYEVGVHIADVSHYVRPYTALDDEAALRCTTVYLVNRRIEMLPALLSSDLCSLKAGVDRLAFSVLWRLDEQARPLGPPEFHKTVIRSVQAFTYAEAQARMDDPARADTVTEAIRRLNALARRLKAARVARGALTLASPEVRFARDEETQDPIDVEMYQLRETNALVEEFMLLANIAAAERIHQHFPGYALLRRHPAPDPRRFEPLQKAVARLGHRLEVGSSLALAQSLDAIEVAADDYVNKLVRILATRCMNQATYFAASAASSPADFAHYGLATAIYTHFTSPIRRYADVIVHRLLAATVGEPMPPLDKYKVARIADAINRRHRMAQMAQRSCTELYTLLFFRTKGTLLEDAYVTRLKTNGFIVLVPRYGVEGAIVLPPDQYQLDEETQELRPLASAPAGLPVYRVFDQVRVQVQTHQPLHSHKPELLFTLPTPGAPVTPPAAGVIGKRALATENSPTPKFIKPNGKQSPANR